MEFAGARLPPGMIHELETATLPKHNNVRTVQLEGSSAKAEAYISGKPLWRQNEPDEDPWLAQQIAADMAAWVHKLSGIWIFPAVATSSQPASMKGGWIRACSSYRTATNVRRTRR